ncbi:MAG: hypothetical protein NW215_05345 [Hyphomicrobiales bacterium]|nr:hypothetical protein [Hyphomicrobiales bacterium]
MRFAFATFMLAVCAAPVAADTERSAALSSDAVGPATSLAERGPAEPSSPDRALRSALGAWRALHDRAVHGDAAALDEADAAKRSIADAFAKADPKNSEEAWNWRMSAAEFLLLGGDARSVRRLLSATETPSGSAPPGADRLYAGALAYGERRWDAAAELLSALDPRAQNPRIGGALAMVQAIIAAERAPAEAQRRLDDARLLAPGSFVEEAALRRALLSPGDLRPGGAHEAAAQAYARRFPRSAHAAMFFARAAQLAARTAPGDAISALRRISASQSEPARRSLMLEAAREALAIGATQTALETAREAAAPSTPPHELARARLYEAAALVASEAHREGARLLGEVRRELLAPPDQNLYDSAATLGAAMASPPQSFPPADSPPTPADPPETALRTLAEANALLTRRGR